MRSFGWSSYADPGGRRRAPAIRSRAVLSLALIAPLLAGACETDKEAQRPLPQSQAHRDMHDSSERLSEPLEGTMSDAKISESMSPELQKVVAHAPYRCSDLGHMLTSHGNGGAGWWKSPSPDLGRGPVG